MYQRMQKQQKQEISAMSQFHHQIERFFAHENEMFERDFPGFMHFGFAAPPMMMQPIIVVAQPASPKAAVVAKKASVSAAPPVIKK